MLNPGDKIQYTQDAVDMVQLLSRFVFSPGPAGGTGAPKP